MKNEICKEIRSRANSQKAQILKRFFKTGKGQYGYGDKFLGISVPESRKLAKQYINLDINDIVCLLSSEFHEERFIALLLLMEHFKKGDSDKKKYIFNIYINNTKYINNWDLVDISAEHIVGVFLNNRDKDLLFDFASSDNIWERRISIISTFGYIKKKDPVLTLRLAEILLEDDHDLIHKAAGWMLREVGKRCSEDILKDFLKKNYKKMPRTMLRYAIERFSQDERIKYLKNLI